MEREEAAQALALLTRVVRQAKDDTAVQNWGTVWIVHGVTNGIGFGITDAWFTAGRTNPLPFAALWTVILAFNLTLIFVLKKERAGVRSFIEEQIWAIWTAYAVAMVLLAFVNWLIGLQVLFMPAVATLLGFMAFCAFGAVIHRVWYGVAAVFAVASLVIAALPAHQFLVFGALWALTQIGSGIVLTAQRRRAAGTPAPRLV